MLARAINLIVVAWRSSGLPAWESIIFIFIPLARSSFDTICLPLVLALALLRQHVHTISPISRARTSSPRAYDMTKWV